MQVSIIRKSAIVSDFRIDAECYQEKYLLAEVKLLNLRHTVLGDEVEKFCKGIFDIKAECYSASGIPFVRIGDLKDCVVDVSNIIYIPEAEHLKNYKTALKKDDVILSKTAYPAASLVTINECNTSQDTIALKLKKNAKIKSKYLVIFLNSKYGYPQMERWFTGNIQMHLNLSDSRNIKIPLLSQDLQEALERIFTDAIQIKNKSIKEFQQAQSLLLAELGIEHWKPKHKLSYIKNFSETDKAGRIDAEYFQPKYDEIVKAIKSYPGGWDTLGNLISLKDKNFNPHDNVEYKYIELSNIAANGEITDCMVEDGQDLPSRARRKVATGDVIVSSIEGSLSSIALIEKEYDQALCSTGFHVINSKSLNPETLLVLMKSIVGQLQLKKGCSGTILTAINQDEFKQIILPKVDTALQSQIRQKVTESFNLRKQSKHLLECAKRAVEIAIEQNEDAALRFLEEHVPPGCAMINISTEVENEQDENTPKHSRTLADEPNAGRAKAALSGKHPGAGVRLNGVRRRTRKPEAAERISEEPEEYSSTTRFIESSLGIKSYAELAPHLAKGVERVMASLLNKSADELLITPEFICKLHKDAFEEIFPAWAGQYRDRNITVGKHTPPQYYEVPLLVRQYCQDIEARLSALGTAPPITNTLLETLAFAEGRFLSIHPFLDFNGRVTRMLLFALCYRLELPPVELVPKEKQKENYLFALSEGDKLDWQPLIGIWKQRLGA